MLAPVAPGTESKPYHGCLYAIGWYACDRQDYRLYQHDGVISGFMASNAIARQKDGLVICSYSSAHTENSDRSPRSILSRWRVALSKLVARCTSSFNVRFGSKADICSAKWHVRFPPDSDPKTDVPGCPLSAITRHGIYHFFRARGFATSRASSMKSWTTGLSVRFFRVTIPFGTRACCSLTGRTLISASFENPNSEIGTIVRKRPVATRLSEPPRVFRRPFRLSHAAMAGSSSMA